MNDGLKVGDRMILREGGWGDTRYVVPIVRLTPTRIVVRVRGVEKPFVRTGHRKEVGAASRWRYATLYDATPELVAEVAAEVRRRDLLSRIDRVKFKSLTTTQLEAVVAALPVEDA